MLSIILFSTIVNDINFCAITFIQSIHDISLPVVRALEMCKPYRTPLELLVLKGFFLERITFMIGCAK